MIDPNAVSPFDYMTDDYDDMPEEMGGMPQEDMAELFPALTESQSTDELYNRG